MTMESKNIAVIGGGTGIFSVLSGLKEYEDINLSAIVSMADDGGSTGVLRENFGVLPPGDIRRALIALSQSQELLCDLFTYRFKNGNVRGHNFGNLFITALSKMEGDFEKGLKKASTLLNVKGEVIPVTLGDTRLCAELENGQVIKGETNIDIPKHDGNLKIKKAYLKPPCKINPNAKKSILKADLIIIGPGDLYTSVIPNLVVEGIPEVIKKSKAKTLYFCNLMTKFGETNNFNASDFVKVIEEYLGKRVLDYVVVNNNRPSQARIKKYEKENAEFVEKNGMKDKNFKVIEADLIRDSGYVRHDPQKTAKVAMNLLSQ